MDKYYRILGLNSNATLEEVKNAHKKLVKEHHPDKGGDIEKFKEIQHAYEVLTGKQKPERENNGFNPFEQGFNPFEHMFRRKGRNIITKINITLEEFINNTKKQINFNRTKKCGTCHGHGGTDPISCNQCNGKGVLQTGQGMFAMCNNCGGTGKLLKNHCKTCHGRGMENETKTIELNIPKEILDGGNIVLHGLGEEIKDGLSGDLIVVVNLLEHGVYKRDGLNLIRDLEVPFINLILGTDYEFDTLYGKVKINIPKLSKTDKMFRLRGKGIEYVNGIKGDLIVVLKPKLPDQINENDELILNDLKKSENFN